MTTKLALGTRASEEIPNVMRTIANLSGHVDIIPEHTAETKWYPKDPADRTLDAQLYTEV